MPAPRVAFKVRVALYFRPMTRLPPLSDTLKRAFAPERFEQAASEATRALTEHLHAAQRRDSRSSYPAPSPSEERNHWSQVSSWAEGRDGLTADVIARSNHLHDPRYMGHQVASVIPETAATGMVTDMLNNGQAIYEMGPTNAVHEDMLMAEIGELLGLPVGCGGILCHGGTLGNLVALMAAQRQLALDLGMDSWNDGIHAFPQPLVVLVSERAHYCIDRAMRTMGWGSAGTVTVQTNARHQMLPEDLEAQIARCHKEGKRVLAVVGSACTTSAGAYDPLDRLAEACQRHGIWFHVDGAHGASAAFSDRHSHLVRGMELADSVVLDFHKTCGLPALCTGVFYAKHANSFLPFSQHAEYLWESATDEDWWDTGKRTFECTKRMLSTRLAAIKAEHGWGLWTELVDRMWALGAALATMVEQREGWELAMTPEANIVCFRPLPEERLAASWDDVVKALRQGHLHQGSGYVVQTEFDGKVWLRCTMMNPLTSESDMSQMLDEMETMLSRLLDSSRPHH